MSDSTEAVRKIEDKREELEALADSDAATAWVAEELLEAAEERGGT